MNLINTIKRGLILYSIAIIVITLFMNGTVYAENRKSIDIAWNGNTFALDTDPEGLGGKFGGTHYIIRGIIYPGGTLSTENCNMIDDCGWKIVNDELQPQFPDKVIGRNTGTGWFLTGGHVDGMLNALMNGDIEGFINEYMVELGQATSKVSMLTELEPEGYKLADQMIIIEGMIGTLLPGEHLVIPITGGTGKFKNLQGEAILTMITLINGAGSQTFNLEFPVNIFEEEIE